LIVVFEGYGVCSLGDDSGDVYVCKEVVNVLVIDPNDIGTSTNPVVNNITVGTAAFDITVSPPGPEVGDIYVTTNSADSLSVIDPSTNTVVDTIPIGTIDSAPDPTGVAVSPTGPEAGDIYTANFGGENVSVIKP
jgi:YVTN family beta-propeller protein